MPISTDPAVSTLELLLGRRSAKIPLMGEPGPTAAQLQTILTVAARVPDHKRLVPWRFIVIEGVARARFGEVLASACAAEEREPPSPARLETERNRLMYAPTVVTVVSRVVPTPGAPEWEQILSCGAACMNLTVAANAFGLATCWVTGWYAYSPTVGRALDLAANERVAGFIHIGTTVTRQDERERPALEAIVSSWTEPLGS